MFRRVRWGAEVAVYRVSVVELGGDAITRATVRLQTRQEFAAVIPNFENRQNLRRIP